MKRHHLRSLSQGAQIRYEKMIGEILAPLGDSLPLRLNIVQQGAFALGYYHQRQKLYTKKDVSDNDLLKVENEN